MNDRTPANKFTIGGKEYRISQEVHEDKQDWRKQLVLVSSLPERMVGIVESFDDIEQRKPFKLHATLIYIADLSFAPVVATQETPQGPRPIMENGKPKLLGIQGSTKLHALIPYDFIGTPTIEVNNWQYVIRVADQDDGFKKWMYDTYLNFFDPPKVDRIIK